MPPRVNPPKKPYPPAIVLTKNSKNKDAQIQETMAPILPKMGKNANVYYLRVDAITYKIPPRMIPSQKVANAKPNSGTIIIS